jgi:hypothetical protein
VFLRMHDRDSEIYPNWYRSVAGGLRAAADDEWTAILRPRADASVFPVTPTRSGLPPSPSTVRESRVTVRVPVASSRSGRV